MKAMQKLSIRQFLTMFEEDNLMGNSGKTIKEKWTTYIQSRQQIYVIGSSRNQTNFCYMYEYRSF
jgi:hypothetical protein